MNDKRADLALFGKPGCEQFCPAAAVGGDTPSPDFLVIDLAFAVNDATVPSAVFAEPPDQFPRRLFRDPLRRA